MNLDLVNVFEHAYETWATRDATLEERMRHSTKTGELLLFIRERLKARVENHLDAAKYILKAVTDNGLENHIENYLRDSFKFNTILNIMPKITPTSIVNYKESFQANDLEQVSIDINNYGNILHNNQYLFHGGFWSPKKNNLIIIDRPLSTSFCPQVALRNAEWKGKAYDSGEVHLFVLRVTNPKTKVYIFSLAGELGNEKEVLFSSGAKLEIRNKILIRTDYNVCKAGNNSNTLQKQISAYILEVDIT